MWNDTDRRTAVLRDKAFQNPVFTAQRKTFQVLMTKTQGRLKSVLGPMLNHPWVKVKVKFTLEQTTKPRDGVEV
jgi:rRNA processing protein Gar1